MASNKRTKKQKVAPVNEECPPTKQNTENSDLSEEIKSCQKEIDDINFKASEAILSVEQKYNNLRRPLYERRSQFIERVPKFWITAILNHPQLCTLIAEEEENCLHHLTLVKVEECEDIKAGFCIHFHFEENEYFTNNILTKEFKFSDTDSFSNTTEIDWKPGKNIIELSESLLDPDECDMVNGLRTFFTWLIDNTDPSHDDVAEVIKDDLWQNPVTYFSCIRTPREEDPASSSTPQS